MGIIARQSSKKTIISFVGVLIGAISILFIYPNDKETYGLALFLFSMSNLLMIIISLGSHGLIIKYYPVFEKMKRAGFISLILMVVIFCVLLMSGLLYLLKPFFYKLLELLDFRLEQIKDNATAIYLLTILLVFIQIILNQASNFKRIVIPSILFELSYKIALPILILLVFLGRMNKDEFIIYYIIFFALVLLSLIFYLKSIGGLKFEKPAIGKLSKGLRKEMLVYMLFSGLNQIGANIVARIDTIMVATLISLTDTGIYGILLFMANVIDIPVRSINQIAGPVISSSMEHGDRENVSDVYKKSSINALITGLFIFLVMWAVLNNILQLMPKNEELLGYTNVFLFLGFGKLFDMTFSTNTHIIIYSKYYKYNLFFVLFLGGINLVLNYLLIQKYGMVGAAMATAISLVLYNVIKLFFIRIKLKYWPFTIETVKLLLVGMICFVFIYFLPDLMLNWIDLIIKGGIITLVYIALIKILKVNADIIVLLEDWFFKLIRLNKFNK
jgi:O-antigen/teichoic acid export membrane protein